VCAATGLSCGIKALLIANLVLVLGLYVLGAAWLLGARLSNADRFVFALQQTSSSEVLAMYIGKVSHSDRELF